MRSGLPRLMLDALTRISSVGAVSCLGTLSELRLMAIDLGWAEQPIRRGDGPVTELRPVTSDDAHPRSLSAIVGLGQQPLHTDGAHLVAPPDVVVLASTEPSETGTRLYRLGSQVRPLAAALTNGLFSIADGGDRFLATALADGRLRFDPGCMTPCDQRARTVAKFFEAAYSEASVHNWSATEGQLLVIDNRRMLQAREAHAPLDEPRVIQRVAFRTPEAP